MNYQFSRAFAQQMDDQDDLRKFRQAYHIPRYKGKTVNYFTGNSLGLQPECTEGFIKAELDAWRDLGVEGHFKGKLPWMEYHKFSKQVMGDLVGAGPSEVVAMNSLTANLHLLMVSFYTPTRERYKIIIEAGAFPSDQYAMQSQIDFHDLNREEALIELTPRPGESLLRTEDITARIEETGDSLALVLLSGVQYFTGQYFDMRDITLAGHMAGAKVGFDLAHAIGNVPLELHDIGADFAVWCTYKYLNAGPGNIGGAFVHERHAHNQALKRFAGWWGHDEERRFLMEKEFVPMPGVDGWQLSNTNVIASAALLGSLSLFKEVGMLPLREKSLLLTGFLEYLVKEINKEESGNFIEILTPKDADQRGCQLSLAIPNHGKKVFELLSEQGIVVDWREPHLDSNGAGIMRAAPVPMYNSFTDVYILGNALKAAIQKVNGN